MRPGKILFTCCILLQLSLSVRSQTSVLKGRVFDQKDTTIVIFANVFIEDSLKNITGINSDLQGNYLIKVTSPGKFTVKCTHVAYNIYQKNSVVISPGDTTILDIGLKQAKMITQ